MYSQDETHVDIFNKQNIIQESLVEGIEDTNGAPNEIVSYVYD